MATKDPQDVERRRYRDLIEDLNAIVWEMDLESWQFTFVSQNAENILGYPVAQWRGEPAFWQNRIVHPDDRERVSELCRSATEEGADHELEYRAIAADGRTVWLHDRVRVVVDEDGRPSLLRGVMVDITAQKRAAEALRESEAKFRQIAENVREVFWIFDPDFTRTIYVSPAFERVFGRPLESVYADPAAFVEAIHPDDVAAVTSAMREIKSHLLEGIEFRVIQPDDSVRWVLARGFPVRDESGEVYRVVGTTTDITAAKEAQLKLTAAEAHYRRLVKNAPYAIYALDAEGRFIELNPAGARFVQREASELIGQHFSTVIAPVDLDVATTAFNQVITGEADHLEFDERILTPSGEERLIRVTESAIREGGVIVGTHGIGRDITGEYEKERQLRRAERLASIGTLIGGVAHELNNPLHSIGNFATLLLEAPRSEEEREDLETIQREALRAAKIVSNLRLLARQTQEEAGARAPVDLNDVVRHVIKTRRYALETRNIEVRQDLADTLPAVLADRGQMEQVVLNLVVNAQQAMEASEHRRLILRTRASVDGVSLHVVDSGPGIAADHIEHIFDPFFTTKSPGDGTGLGLSLVHGIISEHGGAIHADSEPGKGTAFHVELPRAPQAERTRRPAPEVDPPTRPLRILVVDDEPAIRRALSRYLSRRRGHTVDEAAEGGEALRILLSEKAGYDIILSDLRMPGLGGDQLLSQLARLGTGMDRRVMFLTGDAASGNAARILAAANAPVIYKPVELADLAIRIERHAEDVSVLERG